MDRTAKTLFYVFLLAFLGIGMSAPSAWAQVNVTLPVVSADVGTSQVIPVNVDDLTGVGVVGYSFTVSYDPAILTITGTDKEGTLSEEALVVANTQNEGEIRVSAASANELVGSGAILKLTVDVLAEGESDLMFTDFLFNEGNPGHVLSDGTFTGMTATNTANESDEFPDTFTLKGNYPNPFNPVTTVQFDLPQTAQVSITVLDILGREVASVPAQQLQAGANHSIQVDASGLTSGIYLYRVVAQTTESLMVKTGTMTLLK